MSYVGTKKIKGKKYYNLGHGEYIKAGNVARVHLQLSHTPQ